VSVATVNDCGATIVPKWLSAPTARQCSGLG
jgi:hypothetical protein